MPRCAELGGDVLIARRKLEAGTSRHGHRWFRWFNEVPVLFLLAAVVLVVVKPF